MASTDKTVQIVEYRHWRTARDVHWTYQRYYYVSIFTRWHLTLASGSADGTIRFWDTGTGAPLPDRITEHTQSVKAATFFEDNSTLTSVAFNGVITFWDVKTSQKSTIQAAGHRDLFPTLSIFTRWHKTRQCRGRRDYSLLGGRIICFA